LNQVKSKDAEVKRAPGVVQIGGGKASNATPTFIKLTKGKNSPTGRSSFSNRL